MANYVSVDHLKFLLREVHGIDEVLAVPRFSDYDTESIEMLLDAAQNYGDQELYPYFTEMDRLGGKFENGSITCHPQIKRVMETSGSNGYICSHFDYEDGGSQMPHMASMAASFITSAANNSAIGYVGLTSGAAGLIKSYGSQELFDGDRVAVRLCIDIADHRDAGFLDLHSFQDFFQRCNSRRHKISMKSSSNSKLDCHSCFELGFGKLVHHLTCCGGF